MKRTFNADVNITWTVDIDEDIDCDPISSAEDVLGDELDRAYGPIQDYSISNVEEIE